MNSAIISHLHHLAVGYMLQYLPSKQWRATYDLVVQWQEQRTSPQLQLIDVLPVVSNITIGGNYQEALPVSAAWIMYRMSARLFDDLHDEHMQNNLRKTSSSAICWLGLANSILASIDNSELCQEILTRFNYGLAIAARAEYNKPQSLPKLEDSLQIMGEKTGIPFATAIWAGARMKENRPELYEFGHNAGMAIQIFDNVADIVEDVEHGEFPFLIAYTEKDVQRELVHLVERREGQSVLDLLHASGTIKMALTLANLYKFRALKAIEFIPAPEKALLVGLIVEGD